MSPPLLGNSLNVYKYLTYLFEHLLNVKFLMKPKLLEDFLPWAKNVQEHWNLKENRPHL